MLNQENLEALWFFINERHRVYLKKEAGGPKPWTNDPAIQSWRFCNVFRRLDRVSDYLIKKVIEPHWENDPALMLFNVFAFRAFNWPETYEAMGGWQTDWNLERVQARLSDRVWFGNQLFSPAYIIRGSTGEPKWKTISRTLNDIWGSCPSLARDIGAGNTLEDAFGLIMERQFWCWGQFTTYQVVLDLTYSPILQDATDINTWCSWGNGALKGLRRIWPDMKRDEALDKMRWLLAESTENLEPHVPWLTLQDIEFSLCELHKFITIKEGGKGKVKYQGVLDANPVH